MRSINVCLKKTKVYWNALRHACGFLFNYPALVCLCWFAGASYDELWFFFYTSDRCCGEANVTTPGDAPTRDWTALPSWPRLSNRSLVRAPSCDPHGRTPITLRTWIGSRRPRHTQHSEAPGDGLCDGLCNSCDGQRRPPPPLAPAPCPGLACPLRWRGGAASGFPAPLGARISRGYL